MIDPSSTLPPQARPDAGYSSWSASMRHAVMKLDPDGRTAGPIPTFGSMVHQTALARSAARQAYAPAAEQNALAPDAKPDIAYDEADKKEYTFADVLDVINPLQHLPVIGTLYRMATGDEMKPMSGIVGGAIFGGPIGAVASTINAIVKDRTGKDITENALSLVGVNTAPGSSANTNTKPSISYGAPVAVSNAGQENTPGAAKSYQIAAYTPKNFAGAQTRTQTWNA